MTQGDLLHVELGLTRRSRGMKSNHLSPKQVLPWGNTGRDSNSVNAAVRDHFGGSPITPIVAILLNLEPTGF